VKYFLAVVVLLVIALSVVLLGIARSTNAAMPTTAALSNSDSLGADANQSFIEESTTVSASSGSAGSTDQAPIAAHEHSEVKAQDETANSAAQFDALPPAMQAEIKQLSGRYNENVQPIEAKPGVFILPPEQSVRVVPVAVMNEDGTVSIYEY
jgi:hypothetical protein